MKSILLASFVERDRLDEAMESINKLVGVMKSKIFIFSSSKLDNYILTYNISPEFTNLKFSAIWPDTISIHRKKDTNTLFSINAINEIIKFKTGGVIDKNYKVRWSDYPDSILLIRNGRLSILPIVLVSKSIDKNYADN